MCDSDEQTARNCFEFVRDTIKHSADHRQNPVTCRASDVLQHKTGYCYAKSHLLCALLRASGIPAGLCYQRLSLDGHGPPFCLHGLNAVYLSEYGWYRIDARGNRSDVDAQFTPPIEKLAFPITVDGERDLIGIWEFPHSAVTECLFRYDHWSDVNENLPDIEREG
ncbi:transglutaminase-like domain-containing protein [Novipirellula artificiosorum]|uniref:transglutaminase-like domain-containing protein n=1 Tax=Novipirellula artificiosorum TaxID=2528016 RepID=UPI0021BC8D65|nr:transglutaminase-like domain-containing protein [Novipirellula artificiosorum]